MIRWKNQREGHDYLRVSLCGRFVIRRLEKITSPGRIPTEPPRVIAFQYEAQDLHEGRTATLETLQAACKQAEAWARDTPLP